jgi:2-polyprenyl-3-methyl-5-hydroxy-6-metoxy-1,4-benzoquinol methylase
MAFSSSEGKKLFADFLYHFSCDQKYRKFLDVGAGAGLYADIIHETFKDVPLRGEEYSIDAVEAFPGYITRYNLMNKYNRVFLQDIRNSFEVLDNDYDVIICGDVLEHLTKDEAISVIDGLKKKCRFVWCSLPIKYGRPWSHGYEQGEHEWAENPYNKHLHDWTAAEICRYIGPLWLVPFPCVGVFLVEGRIR